MTRLPRDAWSETVQKAAAAELGRRHYRWYTFRRVASHITPLLLAAGVLAVLAVVVTTAARVVDVPSLPGLPWLLRAAAGVLVVVLAGWVVVQVRRGPAGSGRTPLPAFAIGGAVVLLVVSFVVR